MNSPKLEKLHDHAHYLIRAAEDWGDSYLTNKDEFEKMLKLEARIARKLRRYFKQLAGRASSFVNWGEVMQSLQAYDVVVDVNDDKFNAENQIVINLIIEDVRQVILIGVKNAEAKLQRNLGRAEVNQLAQKAALEQVGDLVGMKNVNGKWIPNPNAKYRISQTTRDEIKQSIQKSIQMRENLTQTIERLRNVIDDPERAALIARTETVRAFNMGRFEYGMKTGSQWKVWVAKANACEHCQTISPDPIPYGDMFQSDMGATDFPPLHPRCQCDYLDVDPPTYSDRTTSNISSDFEE